MTAAIQFVRNPFVREKETKKESLRFGLKRNENKADKKMASK